MTAPRLLASIALITGTLAIETLATGRNLLHNGTLDQDTNGDRVPDHWRRSVQPAEAEAVLRLENRPGRDGDRCILIHFKRGETGQQARIIQNVPVKAGATYELAFSYRTANAGTNLSADVLLLGTGPLYRSIPQSPSTAWVRRRVIFTIPEKQRGRAPADGFGEPGEAVVLVQNRSHVPVWYDDLSFREVDVAPHSTADFRLQPVRSSDAILFPGSGKASADFRVADTDSNSREGTPMPIRLLLLQERSCLDLGVVEVEQDHIRVPLKAIPFGESILCAQRLEQTDHGLAIEAEHRQRLLRLAEQDVPEDMSLDRAPVLEVGGRPVFPLGMYGVRAQWSEAVWQELADHGFNTVHDYLFESSSGTDTEACRSYLDKAQRHGFKVLTGVPRGLAEDPQATSDLAAWVRTVQDHPAILCWYTDEMVCIRHTPISRVASLRELLRREDLRQRPYMPFDDPAEEFCPLVDGLLWGGRSKLAGQFNRLRLGPGKPWIAVVNVSFRGRPAPSMAEQRYLTWAPVVFGARGLFYWMYSEAKWHSGDPDYLDRLLRSARELADCLPWILSKESPPQDLLQLTASPALSVLQRWHDSSLLTVVVPNHETAEGAFTMHVLPGTVVRDRIKASRIYQPGTHRIDVGARQVLALMASRE